jgi:hypothetical protein
MSQTEKMELEESTRKLERIERDTLLITLGGTVLSLIATGSWAAMFGFLSGGVLMLLNFRYLWRFSRRVLEKQAQNTTAYLAGLFFCFILFLGGVAFVLLVLKLPMIAFFLGTLSLLLSIILNSLIFI